MNFKRIITGPILAGCFMVVFVYIISGINSTFSAIESKNFTANVSGSFGAVDVAPTENTLKPDIEINATSAISFETNLQDEGKIIFEKNSDARLPIASLTKLMTAIIVLDNYNLSETQRISNMADSQSPMEIDVRAGSEMTVENLLNITLIASSNKSAYALSEMIGKDKFVELMNQKAKDLKLDNTFFVDPMGVSPSNFSTAKDMARLAKYILQNYPKIAGITKIKELNIEGFGTIFNTDQLLSEIPEIVCSKTGFTHEAKGCLLLVIKDSQKENYSINVILGADDRFLEMKKIIEKRN